MSLHVKNQILWGSSVFPKLRNLGGISVIIMRKRKTSWDCLPVCIFQMGFYDIFTKVMTIMD